MPDQVGLARVEQQQAAAEQPVALPGGDADAAERAAGVHDVHLEVDRLGDGAGPAKMACSDRTVLPGRHVVAATIIWPISWPPKTTGLTSEGTLGPR